MAVNPSSYQGKYSDPRVLSILNERTKAVCQIVLADKGGTGFLIGKNLIMTNNHVLDCLESARKAKAVFFHSERSKAVGVELDPDDLFYTSATPDSLGFKHTKMHNLDFTIVSIKSHPKITEISYLSFSIFDMPNPQKGGTANIIHHPLDPARETTFQRVSFRENHIKEALRTTIHYTTATMPGSSGAPVIDDEGNLFALHRATCTLIHKALLEEEMLSALLKELFPCTQFIGGTLTLEQKEFKGRCATVDGSLLYVFSKGEHKGQYFHKGKMASLFRLIGTRHPSPKKWALDFLNLRLPPENQLADYHEECNTAVPIHAIHDHLQAAHRLDTLRLRYKESQKNWGDQLKNRYRTYYANLLLVLTNTPLPIESFSTNLSVISKTSKAHNKEVDRTKNHDQYEIKPSICETKKNIDIQDLFKDRDSKTIKRVLVLGRAGVGKSALCKKIAYGWAVQGHFGEKFDFVYHLRLHDLNTLIKKYPYSDLDPNSWLSKVIADRCFESAYAKEILNELKEHPEKILLIFDGWDEASADLQENLKTCFSISKTHCLLTSRPGETHQIQGTFDLIVENVGFDQSQIITYAKQFFTLTRSENANAFLTMLHSHSHLLNVAQTPLLLQILCDLWQKGKNELPQTLSSLLSNSTNRLFILEQKRERPTEGRKPLEENPPLMRVLLYQTLGEIALEGLENRMPITKQVIEKVLIENELANPRFRDIKYQQLMSTGLLNTRGEGEVVFLHHIYQEYSVARYISSLSKSDKKHALERQCRFVQTHRYKPHFHTVISLLTGCMWEDSKENVKAMEMFFEWINGGHKDIVGSYQIELTLSCLVECRSEELERRIWEKYKIADFVDCVLGREGARDCLSRWMSLSGRVFTQVVDHIKNDDSQEKIMWFFKNLNHFLKLDHFLKTENVLPVLNLIQMGLSHKKQDVLWGASSCLLKLSSHVNEETLSQFLDWLQIFLAHEERDMRLTAIITLERVGSHLQGHLGTQILGRAQAALIDWIETALCEKHSFMVFGILEGLGSYVKEETITLILVQIQTALIGQTAHSNKGQCGHEAALERFYPHIKAEELTQTSPCPAKNGSQEVLGNCEPSKDHAPLEKPVETLGGFLEKVGIAILDWSQTPVGGKPILNWLSGLNAIKDLAPHVKEETVALILNPIQTTLVGLVQADSSQVNLRVLHHFFEIGNALSSYAKEEMLSPILGCIQTALGNKDQHAREAAVEVLGKLGIHAKEQTMFLLLGCIQTALGDKDQGVRYRAVEALRSIFPYVKERTAVLFLGWIQTALGDKDYFVRKTAVKVLGELAPHVKDETLTLFLNRIQIALVDKDQHVRKTAVKVLGELAPHVKDETLTLFLNRIQIALVDKDQHVREAAIMVLGELAPHVKDETLTLFLNRIQIALVDKDQHVREAAIMVLGKLAPHVKDETLTLFFSLIQTALDDQWVYGAVAEALRKLAPCVKEGASNQIIISCILTAFDRKGQDLRLAAVEVLGKLAPHLKEQVLIQILCWIQTALDHKDYWVRKTAVEVLGKLAPHLKEQALIQILCWIQTALDDKDKWVCQAAAEAFRELAPCVKESALDQILRCTKITLDHKDYWVRKAAVEVLGKLTPSLIERSFALILSSIQTALDDKDYWVREAAVEVLGELAPHLKEETLILFLDCIQMALHDEHKRVKEDTVKILLCLSNKFLLSVFCSQTLYYLEFQSIIFDHFINQSIPLYLAKNDQRFFLHINDMYYTEISFKQFTSLSHLCTAHLTNKWIDLGKGKMARQEEETCLIM